MPAGQVQAQAEDSLMPERSCYWEFNKGQKHPVQCFSVIGDKQFNWTMLYVTT